MAETQQLEPRKPTPQCKGTSIRTGKPCKSTSIRADGYCWSHTTLLDDESERFGHPEQARQAATGVERRYPRLKEQMEKRFEEEHGEIIEAKIRALHAKRGIVVGEGPEQHVELVDDHLTQARASDMILSRAFGRPPSEQTIHQDTQALIVGINGSDPQAREHISALLRRRPVHT